MIYFDNAATTLRKPKRVGQATLTAIYTAAGAGRSGHRPAIHAGELVYQCREAAAELFGVEDCTRVVFTYNATHALNLAIHGLCEADTVVAISAMEHNSVVRPLVERNIRYHVLQSPLFEPLAMLRAAEQAIAAGVNLFIINHVSNVFGAIAPLEGLDALLTAYDIPLILDASQSAGVLDIPVRRYQSLAAVCMPGHKALYGPQGTGILLVLSDRLQRTLLQGGTGSLSAQLQQPDFLPDRWESGTLNVPGIAGLTEGIRFVLRRGAGQILRHEKLLLHTLVEALQSVPDTQVFAAENEGLQCGVLSFRHRQLSSESIAERLAEQGVCVRAGLHCAPLAHQNAGTEETGTVRVSLGAFNTLGEVRRFGKRYRTIALQEQKE